MPSEKQHGTDFSRMRCTGEAPEPLTTPLERMQRCANIPCSELPMSFEDTSPGSQQSWSPSSLDKLFQDPCRKKILDLQSWNTVHLQGTTLHPIPAATPYGTLLPTKVFEISLNWISCNVQLSITGSWQGQTCISFIPCYTINTVCDLSKSSASLGIIFQSSFKKSDFLHRRVRSNDADLCH